MKEDSVYVQLFADINISSDRWGRGVKAPGKFIYKMCMQIGTSFFFETGGGFREQEMITFDPQLTKTRDLLVEIVPFFNEAELQLIANRMKKMFIERLQAVRQEIIELNII